MMYKKSWHSFGLVLAIIFTFTFSFQEITKVSAESNIKIMVGYHKPSPVFENIAFAPIHLGRALKPVNQEDHQWLCERMIGDDTGDNISSMNRFYAELTGIYWAWKNQDKLGNPEYIGNFHYRRQFNFVDSQSGNYSKYPFEKYQRTFGLNVEQIQSKIADFDLVVPQIEAITVKDGTMYGLYRDFWHFTQDYDRVLEIIRKKYPEYAEASDIANGRTSVYWKNMFIMKKDIFEYYCDFLFGVLDETKFDIPALEKILKPDGGDNWRNREPAIIAEALTDIFIIQMQRMGKKVLELPLLYYDPPNPKGTDPLMPQLKVPKSVADKQLLSKPSPKVSSSTDTSSASYLMAIKDVGTQQPWFNSNLPCAKEWWLEAFKSPHWDQVKKDCLLKLPIRERAKIRSWILADKDGFPSTITETNHSIPLTPALNTERERSLFRQTIKESICYLEFGAGGSTGEVLKGDTSYVVSVEGSKEWYDNMMLNDLVQTNAAKGRLNLIYSDIGKTGEWSFPTDLQSKQLWPNYSEEVFKKYNRDFDTILIDGRFRVACALMSIKYHPDATIMIHDFPNRPYYHILLDFLQVQAQANELTVFKVKHPINIAELEKLYEKFKYDAR